MRDLDRLAGGGRQQRRERLQIASTRRSAPAGPERVALQGAFGNRALARLLAGDGVGLLPGGQVHPAVESTIDRRRGGGSSLDAGVRSRVESHLGPLGEVRVHHDTSADALARAVEARAFTTGRDVFFARGEYRPGTAAGDRLLAHELTHVVQQRGAPRSGPLIATEPGDRFEREADRAADAALG